MRVYVCPSVWRVVLYQGSDRTPTVSNSDTTLSTGRTKRRDESDGLSTIYRLSCKGEGRGPLDERKDPGRGEGCT